MRRIAIATLSLGMFAISAVAQDEPLAGPQVEAEDRARALVARDFAGRVARLEVPPEEAALALLELDPVVREATDRVLADRAAALDRIVMANVKLLVRLQSAQPEERRAIYLPDVQQLPGWQAVPDADSIRAWICAPLIVDDRIIGLLTIDKWTPDAFSEADKQVAQLFTDHVAVAINNQRLLREARTRAAQLEVLHHATVRLGAIRATRPLIDEVAPGAGR